MLSLGLADLKGHVGIGFDQGAWLDSAYNAALMFIGPFSVYLGGLLGPRRILLFAAGVFTLTCAFLPLIHSYSLLVAALIVAGLTSGTFYPLTLTFALRNIPLRFLPFTIAFYATFVDGAVNIAPSLFGWYRDHLSWHWMFWNSALIAPVMMICIYFGIPPAPARQKRRPCTQLCRIPVPERRIGPDVCRHPARTEARLVALRSIQRVVLVRRVLHCCARSYGDCVVRTLWSRSLISGNGTQCCWAPLLFWFRFTLTGTIILIPESLAIHGFEADQIGPAVIWSAIPLLLIAFTAALLAASQPGSAAADGCGLRLHRLRGLLERSSTPVHGRRKTTIAPSCSPASDKRLLS